MNSLAAFNNPFLMNTMNMNLSAATLNESSMTSGKCVWLGKKQN